MRGCSRTDGNLDDTNFAKPLPFVGLYAAGSSLVCALLISLDALHGFRKRKLWFPCRWFPLNATTLTLLGVAIKFPVDLNTAMPGHIDQLSKLSGTVLLCTVTANFMPSLGNMNGSDLASNVFALAILVVTVIANTGIQIGTGVIYTFTEEHILVMVIMFLLLLILAASALQVTTTKELLDKQFNEKRKDVEMEKDVHTLTQKVHKYWLMAHTGNPQYVMGRSATCIASGAFCLLGAAVVTEAFWRSFLHDSMFCSGASDYGWSTKTVFYSQAATIFAGTVAPAIRWFNAVSFRRLENMSWSCKEFAVEEYWIKNLLDWRNGPLPFDNGGRRRRKFEHASKNFFSNTVVKLQKGVVLGSKLVRLLSYVPFCCLLRLFVCGSTLMRREPTTSGISPGSLDELRDFVLHLDGEDDLVDLITRSERKDVTKWINDGREKKPTALITLIKEGNSKSRRRFGGVAAALGSGSVESLVQDPDYEPSYCWALPIVTLAAIAMALPNVPRKHKRVLLEGVYQGLKYVRLVENYMDSRGMIYAREAADDILKSIDIHNKWFDEDLGKLLADGSSCETIIERLAEIGRSRFVEFWAEERLRKEKIRKDFRWPGDKLAAHCLYVLATTIVKDYRKPGNNGGDSYPYLPRRDGNVFPWIRVTISDMIGACLTNLPEAINLLCICSSIDTREENVRNAALLLGEAEDILPILEEQEAPEITLDEQKERVYPDGWVKKLGEDQMV